MFEGTEAPRGVKIVTEGLVTGDFDRAASFINNAAAQGCRVTVDGWQVKSFSGYPAQVWGTGSLSVNVKAQSGRGVATKWWKPGARINVQASVLP